MNTGGGIVYTNQETLGDGVYYLEGDTEIKVTKTITVTGDATLCLNGKKLTIQNVSRGIIIQQGASLTLCDCQAEPGTLEISTTGYVQTFGIVCDGDFTMTGGNLSVLGELTGDADLYGVYAYQRRPNITVTGGTISVKGPLYANCYAIFNATHGTTTLSGSAVITAEAKGGGYPPIEVVGVYTDTGELHVEDNASVTATATGYQSSATGVFFVGGLDGYPTEVRKGYAYISGGTITATSQRKNGFGVNGIEGNNVIVVSGGKISGSTYGVNMGVTHYLWLSGNPVITGESGTDVFLGEPNVTEGSIRAHDGDNKPYKGNSDDPLIIGRDGKWNVGDVVISYALEEHLDIFGLAGETQLSLRHKDENVIVDEKVIFTPPELTKETITDISEKKDLLSFTGSVQNEGFHFEYAVMKDITTV